MSKCSRGFANTTIYSDRKRKKIYVTIRELGYGCGVFGKKALKRKRSLL